MDEKKINKKSEGESDDLAEGYQQKTAEQIEAYNKAAERLENANKEAREIQKRMELGGNSDAGEIPEKEIPMTPEEYSQKVLSGEINPLEVL